MDKQKITLSLDKDIVKKVKIHAIEENRSVSKIVNILLRDYLLSKGIKL